MLLVNIKRSSNLETNRAKNETREHQSKLAQKTSWAKNKLKLKFYQIILFSFPPFAGTGNVKVIILGTKTIIAMKSANFSMTYVFVSCIYLTGLIKVKGKPMPSFGSTLWIAVSPRTIFLKLFLEGKYCFK